MKNLLIAFLTLFISLFAFAERAPDYKNIYKIKNDSVYSANGDVQSLDSFSKQYPYIVEELLDSSNVISADEKNEKVDESNKPHSNFTSSWKFYVIMLAFPVFLILLFLLVFVRGRKKKK